MAGRDERNIIRLVEAPGSVDEYYLYRVDGREMLSTPFEFRLTIRSQTEVPAASAWIGASITFILGNNNVEAKDRRRINGQCVRFEHSHQKGAYTEFVLDITASVASLRLNRDNRIFAEMSVKDVVSKILTENGVAFDDTKVKGASDPREYIVQFNETDFDFISRLMEREGIFYYFRYDENAGRYKHKMYLADDPSGYFDGDPFQLSFRRDVLLRGLSEVETSYATTTSKWATHDYDYKSPTGLTPTTTSTRLDYASKTGTIYEWPGGGPTPDGVRRRSKTAMEEAESATLVIEGTSSYTSLTPGARFEIDDTRLTLRERRLAIRSVTHAVWDTWGLEEGEPSYHQTFTAVPSASPYRPPSITPPAVVRGPQTAVVLDQNDPEGRGRVKARFHWDRHGTSTCWVRVAQQWGGATLGAQWIPRPGWEVLVDFLEGDPDRPLVVGSLYNGDNKPPFDLPANLSQSGWRTRTHPDGGVVNIFQFEDKGGGEEIYTYAGRNLRRDTINDESVDIRGYSTIHVGKDETVTIDGNLTQTIHKNLTETVDQNVSETIGKNLTESVGENYSETVGKDLTVSVGAKLGFTGGSDATAQVGGNSSMTVSGKSSRTVGSSDTHTVATEQSTTVGTTYKLQAGMSVEIQAGMSLKLSVGGNSIEINPAGVQINGVLVTIN